MKSGVGNNDGKDQSFVESSVHKDPTIEKDDSEDNDSHNTDDSYSTNQDNFNIDSVADVYENVGFGNNPIERDEIDDVGFGQNQNHVEVVDGFGQKQNLVEAEVEVGHTTVDLTDPIVQIGRAHV